MKQINETQIEVNGRVYQWDSDFDCFYRIHPQAPETPKERWIKVVVATILLVVIVVGSRYFN